MHFCLLQAYVSCWLRSWHMLQIDNLKCHQEHKWCSVALYARLFLLVSPTYALFSWCYPDKSPAAVSVTSHSHTKPSCCLLTARTIVRSHNTDVYVWVGCLPIIAKVSEAETVVSILAGYLVCWFLTTESTERPFIFFPTSHIRTSSVENGLKENCFDVLVFHQVITCLLYNVQILSGKSFGPYSGLRNLQRNVPHFIDRWWYKMTMTHNCQKT